jgi:hypothetical protein
MSWVFIVLIAGLVFAPVRLQAQTLVDLSSVQIVGNVPFRSQVQQASALGVKRVRFAVRWFEVEKSRGTYSWAETDQKMQLVKQLGMTPIITLFGGNDLFEDQVQPGERAAPSSDAAIKAFGSFAAAVVKRYGTEVSGRDIIYEIWNEPNTKTFWRPLPNPETYSRLASETCRAVREVNPKVAVVALAMEGTPVKKPYFVSAYNIDIYQEWAKRAATKDLMSCVNGISMHPYRKVPETYITEEKSFQDYIASVWTKPEQPTIVNSEWGYQSFGLDGETSQAQLTLRAQLIGVGSGRLTNIYQVTDGGDNVFDKNQTYGLVKLDGKLKMSGEAVQRLLSLVGDYQLGKLTSSSSGLYELDFTGQKSGQHKLVKILWTQGNDQFFTPGTNDSSKISALNLVSGQDITPADGKIPVDGSPTAVSFD